MQDRFKFRAWDVEDERYFNDIEDCRWDEPSGELIQSFEDCLWEPDFIIEQCTGLKDRNGKLIYEGDIVLLSDNRKNYQVFFDEETGQFQAKMPYMSGYEVLNFGIYKPSSSLFTVIGNIHENPELMEG